MIPAMFNNLNKKHLLFTTFGVFAFAFIFDFIVHHHILQHVYQDTSSLWRNQEDMQAHFTWMLLGQFLKAAFFTILFCMGYEGKGTKEGIRFGVLAGLFMMAGTFIQYSVTPMPQSLFLQWCCFGLVQFICMGIVASFIYKKCQGTNTFHNQRAA
jgi:hypothetical protein